MGGNFDNFLICKSCNKEGESLLQILTNGQTSNEFLMSQKRKYCIHCEVISNLRPETYFPLDESLFPWYFGQDLVDIQYLS